MAIPWGHSQVQQRILDGGFGTALNQVLHEADTNMGSEVPKIDWGGGRGSQRRPAEITTKERGQEGGLGEKTLRWPRCTKKH